MKLKKIKYPKFKSLQRYLCNEDNYSIIKETELAMICISTNHPKGFWVATPDPTGDAAFQDSSNIYPLSLMDMNKQNNVMKSASFKHL